MKKLKLFTFATVATALSAAAPMIVTSCTSSEKEIANVDASVGTRKYCVGDSLHKTDIIVYAIYTDGTKQQVVDFTVDGLDETDSYLFTEDDVNVDVTFTVTYKTKTTPIRIKAVSDDVSLIDAYNIDYINEKVAKSQNLTTCHQAVEIADALGYNIQNYVPYGVGQEIAYDIANKCFVIMTGDNVIYSPEGYVKTSNPYDMFKFVDIYNPYANYSQYLKEGFNLWSTLENLVVTTGLDVGYNKNIKNIYYVDTTGTKTVTLNTFCDILDIEAPNDTITHYGDANNVYVDYANEYTEVGPVCYLKGNKATISFGKSDDKTCCSVDSVEFTENVTKFGHKDTGAMVYCAFDNYTKELVDPVYGQLKVNQTSSIEDIINTYSKESCVIRLTNDVGFTDEYGFLNIKDGIKIVLDLNGHSLIDEDASAPTGNIRIQVGEGSSLILMDSQRSDTAAIKLFDTSIEVVGGETSDKAANFILNGANVEYTATTTEVNRGGVYIGKTKPEEGKTYESKFYMYGGKITAKLADQTLDTNAIGLSVRSSGSYAQIIYGEIDTTEGTDCISGNGMYDNSYIDIVSGNFTTNENHACIYCPQEGTLNIVGGSYTGGTCICYKAGDLNISGGVFIANGEKAEPESEGTSGSYVDGSVISLEANGSYDKNPVVTVSNDTLMYSQKAYILDLIVLDDYTGMAEVDFFDGNYLYKEGNQGYRLYGKDATQQARARITQNRGSWSKF